jgi:uncharacterized membrane protein YhaH (DUF805 family)
MTVRVARITLDVAIVLESVLLIFASQQDWRMIEYIAWIPWFLLGVASIEITNLLLFPFASDATWLRHRSSVVIYLASLVIFAKLAFVVMAGYLMVHRVVARSSARLLWLCNDFILIGLLIGNLVVGRFDLYGYLASLVVIVAVLAVAICQDNLARETSHGSSKD